MANIEHEIKPYDVNLRNIPKWFSYFISGLKWHVAGRIYTPKPISVIFAATERCNSHCLMCEREKNQDNSGELSIGEIRELFSNPLFGSLEKLVITGGEPTLRKDIVQIARTVLELCPGLNEISLRTNGLEPDLVIQNVQGILSVLEGYNRPIKFAVVVSIDGLGAVHDRIRGVPQAFEKVCNTIEQLQALQLQKPFYLASNCTVQPLNIDNLSELFEFSEKLNLPLSLTPIVTTDYFIYNDSTRESMEYSDDHLNKLSSFLNQKLRCGLQETDVLFWRDYLNVRTGRRKRFPCPWLNLFMRINSNGSLCTCKGDSLLEYGNIRDKPVDILWYSEQRKLIAKRLKKDVCPRCTSSCDVAGSLAREFFHYAWFWMKKKSKIGRPFYFTAPKISKTSETS